MFFSKRAKRRSEIKDRNAKWRSRAAIFSLALRLFFASRSIHLEKPDILVPGVTSIVVTRCLLCQEPVACFQRSINDVGQWFPHTALDGAAVISFVSYIWGFPAI